MPKKWSPKALKAYCLQSIADNIDNVWCADYIENFKDRPSFMYIIGPFDAIPPNLVNELTDLLRERKVLKKHHLQLLITPQLDRINLADNPLDIGFALKLVSLRCQNLQSLDLSNCTKISKPALRELARAITNIRTLNLRGSSCANDVLSILGGHCKDLTDLNVSWCQDISDMGVMSLCVNMADLGDRTPRCSRVVRLLVTGTNVSCEGAVCVIKNMPDLRYFDFCDICKALEEIHILDLETNRLEDVAKYKLRILNGEGDISIESVEIASTLCPDVKKICFSNANISNEALVLLQRYQNLNELEIGKGSEKSIKFGDGVLPILQTSGSSIVVLTLAEITEVDVTAIGWCCQNLEHFNLLMNLSYPLASGPKAEQPFPRLKTCRIVSTADCDLPGQLIKHVLSFCSDLESLTLQECKDFNDDVLSAILKSNSFPNLVNLELERCDNITALGIMSLLTLDSCLSSLKLFSCKNITRSDFTGFKKHVKRENLNLKVEWT